MLLDQFLNQYNEDNGWFGPYEQDNNYLAMFKINKTPRISNGKKHLREYIYFEFFNCEYCGQNAIRQIRSKIAIICSRKSDCYCKLLMDTQTEGGIAHTRDNPRINYHKYTSWYDYKLDKLGNKIKSVTTTGYERIEIFEHRIVMEEYLGRKLTSLEIVHHIDQDKLNNHINNLWLCNNSEHEIAHRSHDKLCSELMNNYHKYSGISFNKETGKYYLIPIFAS
jgi:hypothetical protein